MTLFVGGPYHGRDLPIEPLARIIRLPKEQELDAFIGVAKSDPGTTANHDWPHLYELDQAIDKSFYRFIDE